MPKKTSLAPPSKEISRLHQEIVTAFQTSLSKAIRIGELLAEQKKALNHGEFIPWIEQNCPFNRKTAHKYMQVFAHQDEFKCLPNETFASAYRLLNPPKSPPRNRESKDPNVSQMRHLDSVTPRNDSNQGGLEEIVTAGEEVPDDGSFVGADMPKSEPQPPDASSIQEVGTTGEEVPPKKSPQEPGIEEPNVSQMRHLDPVTPRNDSSQGGEETPSEEEEVDLSVIDTSDGIFSEVEAFSEAQQKPLKGSTLREIIEASGLPRPLNWKEPDPEPLRVARVRMTGEDEGEVQEIVNTPIWEGAHKEGERLFYCIGNGLKEGQKVRGLTQVLPQGWLDVLYEMQKLPLEHREKRVFAGLVKVKNILFKIV